MNGSGGGLSPTSFYRSPSTPRDIKRIKRLEAAARKVDARKASDALAATPQRGSVVSRHTRFYKVFGRQCEAIEAASVDPSLKVFAFEVDTGGKRQFVACHPERLWAFYKDLPRRHYYEVIPQGAPCKLFFDLEFSIELNPNVDGDQMCNDFKAALTRHLIQTFGTSTSGVAIVDLDSTTKTKFSRHLIVTSHVFQNIRQMKLYVADLCQTIRTSSEFRIQITSGAEGGDVSKGLFVDEGVYTKNRNFRLYLSSKFGKETALRAKDSYNQTSDSRRAIFFDTLVTNVDTVHFLQFAESDGDDILCHNVSNKIFAGMKDRHDSANSSAFPEIDNFILSLVNDLETGRTGYIRKCSENGSFLTYEIAGSYKYCHNVERHHKSNNIRFVVDTDKGQYFQTCHDQVDCKDFRSNIFQLPKDCQPWLEMFDD